jgi:AcrR family transcriptional regulator
MKQQRIPHAETRRQNREQILTAGRVVFATIGYDGATIRDIVRESGLAQGSFYNYFKTKQDVFEQVVEDIITPLIPILREARASADSAHDFMYGAYDACRMLPRQNPEAAAIIARNQSAFREIFYLGDGQNKITTDLIADLKAGQDAGFLKQTDADLMAETMVALGMDLVIQAAQHPQEAKRRVAFLTQLFVDSIGVR